MALLILAGLQLIPLELYEAAEVDGVTRTRRFWRITLPLLRQTLAVALVFRTLDALRVFDLFQIVLGESRYSMASFTYYQLIQNRAAGYSAASGVVIFILIFAFAILYTRILGFHASGQQE
jgi:trehalose/maltose transport system permease protein